MADRQGSGLDELFDLVESLRQRVVQAEEGAAAASKVAQLTRQEVERLRDQVAAAERDQQDLRTARARLDRLSRRGFWQRLLNQGARPSGPRPTGPRSA